MRIAIGSDHRGYNVKTKVSSLLAEMGHIIHDAGANDDQSVDYPDFASAVAKRVAAGEAERGILVCGTGIGMAIAANKVPGIRAVPCHDEVTAEMSRRHNDVNVLCLSGDMLGERNIDNLVRIWLNTDFEGGRHARRLAKISDLENEHANVPGPSEAAGS